MICVIRISNLAKTEPVYSRRPDGIFLVQRRRKMKRATLLVLVLGGLLLVPAAASAQSSFVGIVTDNTGGVLPGVTVEVASPVLIEKVRSAVTDGQGRYTITQLRPGTYSFVFTLTGFGTVKREGVTLSS